MKTIYRYQINSYDDIRSIVKTIETNCSSIILIEPSIAIEEKLTSIVDTCFRFEDWTIGFRLLVEEILNFVGVHFPTDHIVYEDLNDLFVELEWQLEEDPLDNKAYFLDQVITVLPVIYAKIVFQYLKSSIDHVIFIDSRDLFEADNNYGNGQLDLNRTLIRLETYKSKIDAANSIVVLPADIASSTENYGVKLEKKKVEVILRKVFLEY